MALPKRLHPNVVLRQNVACQSSRNGSKPSLIVMHDTESLNRPGLSDLQAIANFFDQISTQASSHVVIDAEGQSARLVSDERKAWTQAFFNPVSLSVEMIGKAAQATWSDEEYWEAARWVARWSIRHDIPIRRALVVGGAVLRTGVARHKDLGAFGGSHVDPGPNFSMRKLRRRARQIKRALKANA